MDVTDSGKPARGKSRLPVILGVAAFLVALGFASLALRFKVAAFDASALVLDRWTGSMVLVQKDGKTSTVVYRRSRGKARPPLRAEASVGTAASSVRGPKQTQKPGGSLKPLEVGNILKSLSGIRLAFAEKLASAKPASRAVKGERERGERERAQPVALKARTIEGTGARVAPRLAWGWGRLHYTVEVEPFTEALKRLRQGKNPALGIELVDDEGFTIRSLRVSLAEMEPVRDDKNHITALAHSGSVPIAREEYLAVRDWRMRKVD